MKDKIKKLIIVPGAQKAGTSSFFDFICRSKNIVEPATKESHFFRSMKTLLEIT